MNFDGLFSLFCLYETEIMTFFAGQTMEKTATKRRNYKKYAIYGTIILAAGFLLLRLFGQSEPISYITEPVKRQDIEKVVNAAGEVRASELVTIGAQVSGKIEKLYVSVGQNVKKGDMIAEIDSTTQQNEVDSTKAKLKSYQAQLTAAQITEKVAQQQYDRTKKLAEQKAASAEDLENAEDVLATAKSKVTELESTIKETEIALSTAETNLGYTRITATLDGTVVSVPVKVGQTINAAMNTPTIVQVADLSKMEILIEISEGDVTNIKPGVKVSYAVLADLDRTYETTLKSIDPGLTLLTNGEYTEVVSADQAIYYYGRLLVDNPDGVLRIGMTTQNIIYVENADNVLTIPVLAVKGGADDEYVDILTSDGVQRRHIKTGITDGMRVEVKEGLNEGDNVILAQMSSSEISDVANNNRRRRGF